MSRPDETEIEVKFFVLNLAAIQASLEKLNAHLEQPRTLELNLRFDTPDGSLAASRQTLRLRQDVQSVLTFKGPMKIQEGVGERQEIEFTVGDYFAARHFLEALGYGVNVIYEKFRAEYGLNGLHITLDEMPFGTYVEIEGPDAATIQDMAVSLGLDWTARVVDSYLALFGRLKSVRGFPFRDLTFANFAGLDIRPGDLGVRPADL